MAILKKHEKNGYTLLESLYPSKQKQTRHTHTPASFSFVLAGSYVEACGGQTFTRLPSTIIFHPPQESHAVNFESEVRILSVRFDLERFEQLREHSTILDEPSSCHSETIAWLGNRIYREFRRMDSFSLLAIEGLVFELLAEASRSKIGPGEKGIPHWLLEAKDFLHDNFAESFVTEDVVKIADVHPAYLSNVFRKTFGCTIGEYIRRLRVEFACRQLSATATSLSEIALEAGFADHSHFARTFKNHLGLTPSEYRKKSRKY